MNISSFLFGDHVNFTLEHRTFNTIMFFGFLIGLFGATTNIFIHFPLYLIISAYAYGVVLLFIYLFSRFRKTYKPLLWPSIVMSFAFLSVFWFPNVGSEGAETFLFIIGLIYYTIITGGVSRVILVVFIIADILFLYTLEYLYPGLVVPYQNRDARFIDMVTTAVYSMVLIFIGVSSIMNNIREDRNRLKKRNESMEKDLAMARVIQMQMIPASSPFPGIAFHYKPMEMIGGDFFDIIELKKDGLIGIFVSDVSGHGVPAAFITSMIKTALLQTAPFTKNPSFVLQNLSSVLNGQTGGNFVTAFYGIYDPATKKLVYSNAGHNSPYLIHDGQVEMLSIENRGYPLAITAEDDSGEQKIAYTNLTVTLKKKSKLLLYTDGMTEAVAIDGAVGGADKDSGKGPETADFETCRLKNILLDLSDLSCGHYVRSIYEKLVEFRGNDRFDDDICIICLDA